MNIIKLEKTLSCKCSIYEADLPLVYIKTSFSCAQGYANFLKIIKFVN